MENRVININNNNYSISELWNPRVARNKKAIYYIYRHICCKVKLESELPIINLQQKTAQLREINFCYI